MLNKGLELFIMYSKTFYGAIKLDCVMLKILFRENSWASRNVKS